MLEIEIISPDFIKLELNIKSLVFWFTVFFVGLAYAAPTIVDSNSPTPTVTVTNTTIFTLITEAHSDGGGASESAGAKIYLPLLNAFTNHAQYSFYAGASNLPVFDDAGTNTKGTLKLIFDIDLDGEAFRYLHIAIKKSDDDYQVIGGLANEGGPEQITTNQNNYTKNITIANLCAASNSACDPFDDTGTTATATTTLNMYVFLDSSNNSGTIKPSEKTNGFYYQLLLSNKVESSSKVNLNNLVKNDEQLVLDYNGFVMSNLYKVYALEGSCDATEDGDFPTLGSLSKDISNLTDLETTLSEGLVKVKNLNNGTCYSFRVIFCDKFGFCSLLSNEKEQTPEKIEQLLNKNGCFFFTAGFGGDHYIVDFFQRFRDRILRQSVMGRKFVDWYYATAPQHATTIIQSPALSAFIRGLGYSLYGIIKYWWISISIIGLCLVQLLRSRLLN